MCVCVCIAVFVFARESNQCQLVKDFHEPLPRWIQEWHLSQEEQRELLALIIDALLITRNNLLSLKLVVRFLDTFRAAAAAAAGPLSLSEAAHTLALGGLKTAIRSPVNAFVDRNQLLEVVLKLKLYEGEDAAAAAAASPAKLLLALLTILCQENPLHVKHQHACNIVIIISPACSCFPIMWNLLIN